MIELIVRAALAGIAVLIMLVSDDSRGPPQPPDTAHPPPYQQPDK